MRLNPRTGVSLGSTNVRGCRWGARTCGGVAGEHERAGVYVHWSVRGCGAFCARGRAGCWLLLFARTRGGKGALGSRGVEHMGACVGSAAECAKGKHDARTRVFPFACEDAREKGALGARGVEHVGAWAARGVEHVGSRVGHRGLSARRGKDDARSD